MSENDDDIPTYSWNSTTRNWDAGNRMFSSDDEIILEDQNEDQWWVAPAIPAVNKPSEWHATKQEAKDAAKKYSELYGCVYEVYKRVNVYSPV